MPPRSSLRLGARRRRGLRQGLALRPGRRERRHHAHPKARQPALRIMVNRIYGAGYTDLCYGYNAFWADCLPTLSRHGRCTPRTRTSSRRSARGSRSRPCSTCAPPRGRCGCGRCPATSCDDPRPEQPQRHPRRLAGREDDWARARHLDPLLAVAAAPPGSVDGIFPIRRRQAIDRCPPAGQGPRVPFADKVGDRQGPARVGTGASPGTRAGNGHGPDEQ